MIFMFLVFLTQRTQIAVLLFLNSQSWHLALIICWTNYLWVPFRIMSLKYSVNLQQQQKQMIEMTEETLSRNGVKKYKDCMGPIIKRASKDRKCPDLVVKMYTTLSLGMTDGYSYSCKDGFESKYHNLPAWRLSQNKQCESILRMIHLMPRIRKSEVFFSAADFTPNT